MTDIPLTNPRHCILHIADTQLNTPIANIEAYWKSIGWKRPGYHVIVDGSGKAHRLEQNKFITNGVRAFGGVSNRTAFHLSFTGGRVGRQLFQDTRTDAQKSEMAEVIKWYLAHYPDLEFMGHNQVNRKMCPIFDAPAWLAEIGVPDRQICKSDPFGILNYIRTGRW
jgi:hypothetical protein